MAKPAVTLRNTKGSALTYTELDTNFTNLKDATVSLTAGSGGTQVTVDLNGNITLVAGTGITLTGDNTAKTVTITGSAAGLTNPLADDLDLSSYKIVRNISGTDHEILYMSDTTNKHIEIGPSTALSANTETRLYSNYIRLGETSNFGTVRMRTFDGNSLLIGVLDSAGGDGPNITLEGDEVDGRVLISPDGAGKIELRGPIKINATAGTPATPGTVASWLKIDVAGTDYYLPLYQ